MGLKITPEILEDLQGMSTAVLTHAVATGEIHPVLGQPIDGEQAKAMLNTFWLDHQDALVGEGIDFLFSFVKAAAFPETPIEEFRAELSAVSTEDLVALAEADAVTTEVAAQKLIAGRQKVIEDFKAITLAVVKGAIASAMAAALGMS